MTMANKDHYFDRNLDKHVACLQGGGCINSKTLVRLTTCKTTQDSTQNDMLCLVTSSSRNALRYPRIMHTQH